MTPKPSEAELRELERLFALCAVSFGTKREAAESALIAAARNALPGLLMHVRRLEIALHEVSVKMGRACLTAKELADDERARAEAAEECVEDLVDFIATGDFTDDARRQAIARAESVLKATPAAATIEEDAGEAVVASGYMGDPKAWCYWDAEYPEEGSCGPFATEAEAAAHAVEVGYAIAKAETALTGAEAGERKPTCPVCGGDWVDVNDGVTEPGRVADCCKCGHEWWLVGGP